MTSKEDLRLKIAAILWLFCKEQELQDIENGLFSFPIVTERSIVGIYSQSIVDNSKFEKIYTYLGTYSILN